MKKILLAMMLISTCSALSAQQTFQLNNNPFPKTITVSGSAEMEIIPDEIYVNITLREYQKKGEDKKDLETIKTSFLEACKSSGLPDSAISIFSYTGYGNYFSYRKRKKDPNLFTSITYQVKFKDSKTMDLLVEKLDDEATQNFQIYATSHSKITEFRKQLKIKAVQAAKDKGLYLTEAISEKLGEAITVKEPDESQYMPKGVNALAANNVMYEAAYAKSFQAGSMAIDKEIDFRKIKLRFEVDVVFALK
jgi:uncharacterized protein YggE